VAWDGYFTLDGAEIINVARTEAYASGQPWFVPAFENDALPVLLGDTTYNNPIDDEAPWVDPDNEESGGFYGVYPLSISGIENSTRGSTVVESSTDGGVPGRLRHGTKAVVFNVVLMGETEAAVEYGLAWLRRALLGDKCDPTLATTTSTGADLAYLASEPGIPTRVLNERVEVVDGGDSAGSGAELGPQRVRYAYPQSPGQYARDLEMQKYGRMLRHFVVNEGPTVTSKHKMSCGGAAWTVSFTGVAGSPFEFGIPKPIIQGFMSPEVSDPWVPGVTKGPFEINPYDAPEWACGDNIWEPIYDPFCAALVAPPGPPSVPMGCFTPPESWARRWITVPAEEVPLWGQVMPVIQVYAPFGLRNMRVRIYETEAGGPEQNPCGYRGDLVFSYIPAGGTMVFDAATEAVWVITEYGHKRRADSLVFRTDGKPFDWPFLSCGYAHTFTFDMVHSTLVTPPVIDISLVTRAV